ncbi:MAG: hypothetical protein ACXVCS_21570, partial [Bdellovibrionota bacterium]
MPGLPLLLAIAILAAVSAQADTRVNGRVFYAKLDSQKASFLFDSLISEKDGKTSYLSSYYDKVGKPIIVEKVETEGDHILRYDYKQNQVEETGFATFEGGKIQMSFTSQGKTEKDTETYDPTTVVAPMIGPLLQKKWDLLMKGETVRIRYLSIERLETIGFKFFKDIERTLNGKPVIDIVMKPSSFFIAALVDPIRISVT